MADEIKTWVLRGLSPQFLLSLTVLIIGQVATFVHLQSTIQEHERRLEIVESKIDKELVPRLEVESKDAMLNQRLDSIESLLRTLIAEHAQTSK